MNRIRLFIAGVLLLAVAHRAAGAWLPAGTNAFTLPAGERLPAGLSLMANEIILDGDVSDDVFLLAAPESLWRQEVRQGSITLAGVFHNDVWALGKRILLTGVVQDHARFAGQTLVINGSIGNAAVFLGNAVHLGRSADIAGNAWLTGDDLIVEGQIEGDLTLIGKTVTLAGTVGQDVTVYAQDFVALPGTEVMGNLVYSCPREFVPDHGVRVHGDVIRKPLPEHRPGVSMESLAFQAWLLLGALLSAAVFMALFPGAAVRSVHCLRNSLWRCLAVGGMILFLSPLLLAVALLSLVGIPLGLTCASGLAILAYLAKIPVAIALGLWLLRRPDPRSLAQTMLPLCAGLLLVYASVQGEFLGRLAWFLLTSAGLGSLVLAMLTGPAARPPPHPEPGAAAPAPLPPP